MALAAESGGPTPGKPFDPAYSEGCAGSRGTRTGGAGAPSSIAAHDSRVACTASTPGTRVRAPSMCWRSVGWLGGVACAASNPVGLHAELDAECTPPACWAGKTAAKGWLNSVAHAPSEQLVLGRLQTSVSTLTAHTALPLTEGTTAALKTSSNASVVRARVLPEALCQGAADGRPRAMSALAPHTSRETA